MRRKFLLDGYLSSISELEQWVLPSAGATKIVFILDIVHLVNSYNPVVGCNLELDGAALLVISGSGLALELERGSIPEFAASHQPLGVHRLG